VLAPNGASGRLLSPHRSVSPPPLPEPPPEPPPPSEATVALGDSIARALIQYLGLSKESGLPRCDQESLCTSLVTTFIAEGAVLAGGGSDLDLMEALAHGIDLAQQRVQKHSVALAQWLQTLAAMRDHATLRQVLTSLTAQRYTHPPATARTVGQVITALETYLEIHAPTSTTHPARHAVEL
jgi:hypothetical protein